MKIIKLILSAVAAWALGLAFIATTFYFTNDGADFTGNLPVFVILLSLINRKMVLAEALGFMATFAIIGTVFGLGFTWTQAEVKQG